MTARYMIVTYFQKPNGKWDEVTSFKNSINLNKLTAAKVILDFKNRTVVKNTLNPEADFEIMLEFYKRQLGDQLTPHLPQESP